MTTLLRYRTLQAHIIRLVTCEPSYDTLVPTSSSVVAKKHRDTQHQQGLCTVGTYHTPSIHHLSHLFVERDNEWEPPFTPLPSKGTMMWLSSA